MHNAMTRLAQLMAILGALVLSFLIVMTCVSVAGRDLNALFNSDVMATYAPGFSQAMLDLGIGPILGDFELLENMMAFAIFAFLPLAQLHSAHATVDVFTARFPKPVLAWMRAITELVFALVLVTFAVKLYQGMQGKMRYNETTYLTQFPVWWAYAAAFAASCVAAAMGVYMAVVRVIEAVTGAEIAPDSAEAEH